MVAALSSFEGVLGVGGRVPNNVRASIGELDGFPGGLVSARIERLSHLHDGDCISLRLDCGCSADWALSLLLLLLGVEVSAGDGSNKINAAAGVASLLSGCIVCMARSYFRRSLQCHFFRRHLIPPENVDCLKYPGISLKNTQPGGAV